MSPAVPGPIVTAIEQLELEARTCETRAGELQDRARQCRDAATEIRRLWAVSPMAPARHLTTPGKTDAIRSTQKAAQARPKGGPPPVVTPDPFDAGDLKVPAGFEVFERPPRRRRTREVTAADRLLTNLNSVSAPAVTPSVPAPVPGPERTHDPTLSDARVAVVCERLLEAFPRDGQVLKFGEISQLVGDPSRADLMRALERLVNQRHLARVSTDGATTYRRAIAGVDLLPLPVVRSLPIPTLDPVALREGVEQLLATGQSFDLHELVRALQRNYPYADKTNVNQILEQLVAATRVEVLTLGVRVRYRRLEGAAEASA